MYLDISHKPAEFIRHHFPMIYEKLLGLGIDLTKEPSSHCAGGTLYLRRRVMVDDHGRTDVDGLYAIGEVSYRDYGANRMASNSLLECLVYGWSAAEDIVKRYAVRSDGQ